MTKKRKDFLNALYDIAYYWKDKKDATFETIFNVLVMFDGYSGVNDFKKIEIKDISNENELHYDFCKIKQERRKEK